MGKVSIFTWAFTVLLLKSNYRQAYCSQCSGFLRSQRFDQLFFTFGEQRTLRLVTGFQFEIECRDDGGPVWYYNDQIVPASNSSFVYQISEAPFVMTLKFTIFALNYVGKYTCRTPGGDCSIDISAGNPVINFDTQSDVEHPNSATSVHLTYAVMGYPFPTSDDVTWSHNGEPLEFQNTSGVLFISNGLIIPPTFTSDQVGDYTATVRTSAGSGSDSFYFSLDEFPSPSLLVECSACVISGDNYTLNPRSSITVMCNDTGKADLHSLEIIWRKDNQSLTEDEYNITHISQGASTLLLENVSITDAGTYDCFIQNDVGSDSKRVHIYVLSAPRLVPFTKSPLVVPTGSVVTLEVAIFDAFPPVERDYVIWSQRGDIETFNQSYATATFRDLCPVKPLPVTIKIRHQVRCANYTFLLFVFDPPPSPVNFTVTGYQGMACTAIFMWQPGISVDPLADTDQVGLEWSPNGSDPWRAFGDKLYPVNESQVFTLKPEAEYYFRAYSWNNYIGRGAVTMKILFSTVTKYRAELDSLVVTSNSSSELHIFWKGNHSQSDCYTNVKYELICYNSRTKHFVDSTTIKADVDTSNYSVTYDGLTPDTLFKCYLYVTGKSSSGPPLNESATASGYTLPKQSPTPPSPAIAASETEPGAITMDFVVSQSVITTPGQGAAPSSTNSQFSSIVSTTTAIIGSSLFFSVCFVGCGLMIWMCARKLKRKGPSVVMNEREETLPSHEHQPTVHRNEYTPLQKSMLPAQYSEEQVFEDRERDDELYR